MSNTGTLSAGLGLITRNSAGDIIEVFYPKPIRSLAAVSVEFIVSVVGLQPDKSGYGELDLSQTEHLIEGFSAAGLAEWSHLLDNTHRNHWLICLTYDDKPPGNIPEAFLKLHLLSHRLFKPHEQNLDGLFGALKNLAWTNEGPVDLADLPARQLGARKLGSNLEVQSVDKFPRMANYVVPSGVRLADTARVRLGAYIGEGTTVMHEGFVNFNAGTLGTAMIEGRVSAGVVVGVDSDLGGSSSTMGTLSGGGTQIISVGKNCLIGANAGIGFPLADGCTVEAGLYVTAGTKVNLLNASGTLVETVKASRLCTEPNLLFRRNSLTGAVEALPQVTHTSLNYDLHSNN
ncbi:MAG TPA: 2,3,4,5-tetrahydropyridine-2,6-dicarboxylate N-succinyltransferase [Gammaproteobacteria bacterium]|nr:2,3,4,5-tetrahydropyridine-2,6-dicarboxylate N-succinyltransferase [Gammaproteobacteria bacterium]|tara:strand:+ start:562 stop:1599 length:1038 start_codon:yes stop_codon:yes gene_type:complete